MPENATYQVNCDDDDQLYYYGPCFSDAFKACERAARLNGEAHLDNGYETPDGEWCWLGNIITMSADISIRLGGDPR